MTPQLPPGPYEAPSRRRVHAWAVAAACFVAGCGVAAAEPEAVTETKNLQLSGFGTLGLVHVNARPGAGFERDTGERANDGGTRGDIDTRLGLQANYRASTQLEFVAQVVGANRTPTARPSDAVTLAFGAWRANDDLTLRAGRMSTDYYLLADYRNVGFAYPFVRPPIENYSTLPYFIDGLDLTKAWRSDETVWKLRAITGRSQLASNRTSVPLGIGPDYALVLSRDDGDGLLFKTSVSRVRLHNDSSAVQPLQDALGAIAALPNARVASEARDLSAAFDYDGRSVVYYSLGLSLDRDAWLASVEVSRCQPQVASSYTSAWGLVGHRWGALTAYGVLSAIRTDQSRSPPRWAAALTPLIGGAAALQAQQVGAAALMAADGTNATQRTVAFGLRWDFSDRMALKLQWDRVRVDAYASRLWANSTPGEPINANIVSVALDFVF